MEERERIWRERGLRDAVLSGDESAWRQWYEEVCPRLQAYIVWRCGGLRDEADEVLQETWLLGVRRLTVFDPTAGSFLSWLRGIAANLLRNRFRWAKRQERVCYRGRAEVTPPDAEVLRQEQSLQVARVLAELPEHYEAVLRAKYLDERSVADIARERGESVKAVESLLTRARDAFRSAYQPE